jgi:hypothetical protein
MNVRWGEGVEGRGRGKALGGGGEQELQCQRDSRTGRHGFSLSFISKSDFLSLVFFICESRNKICIFEDAYV